MTEKRTYEVEVELRTELAALWIEAGGMAEALDRVRKMDDQELIDAAQDVQVEREVRSVRRIDSGEVGRPEPKTPASSGKPSRKPRAAVSRKVAAGLPHHTVAGEQRACQACGRPFTPRRKDQKFCTDPACRKARHRGYLRQSRARGKPPLAERRCEKCGRTFLPRRKDQRFCSNCSTAASRRRNAEARPPVPPAEAATD